MFLHSLPVALVLAATLGAKGCGGATPGPSTSSHDSPMTTTRTPFVVLLSAPTSGFDESTELVLRDAKAFEAAWRTAHNGVAGNPAPAVDFQRDMVILLATGARRTGGFAIRFDSITTGGTVNDIHYTVTSPGPTCMTTQMLTSPVMMVRVSRLEGAIRFQRHEATDSC